MSDKDTIEKLTKQIAEYLRHVDMLLECCLRLVEAMAKGPVVAPPSNVEASPLSTLHETLARLTASGHDQAVKVLQQGLADGTMVAKPTGRVEEVGPGCC